MDSPAADSVTYFIYHDAQGNAHVADSEASIPRDARQVQQMVVREPVSSPYAWMNRLLHSSVGRALPAPVQSKLVHMHASTTALVIGGALLIFILRSSFLRSLFFKVVMAGAMLIALGGGYLAMMGKQAGMPIAQGGMLAPQAILDQARGNAAAMENASRAEASALDAINHTK